MGGDGIVLLSDSCRIASEWGHMLMFFNYDNSSNFQRDDINIVFNSVYFLETTRCLSSSLPFFLFGFLCLLWACALATGHCFLFFPGKREVSNFEEARGTRKAGENSAASSAI